MKLKYRSNKQLIYWLALFFQVAIALMMLSPKLPNRISSFGIGLEYVYRLMISVIIVTAAFVLPLVAVCDAIRSRNVSNLAFGALIVLFSTILVLVLLNEIS